MCVFSFNHTHTTWGNLFVHELALWMGITCIRGSVFNRLLVHLVRYIQQQASPTNRAICDYHFFNTYFYKKLKEAVSYKVFLFLLVSVFHN
jgi:hypothetical protein